MLFSGVALFFPAFLAYFMEENEFIYNFGFTGFITFIIGCFLFFLSSEKDGDLRTKDGFIFNNWRIIICVVRTIFIVRI